MFPMSPRLASHVLFLVGLMLPLTTTSTANVDTMMNVVVDSRTVDNKTSPLETVTYQHCTIDGLFCLPSNYSK